MIPSFKAILKRIIREGRLLFPLSATQEEIAAVHDFHINYRGHRSLSGCAKETGISINKCARIKKYLYENRQLGTYFFQANTPPQSFMRQYILERNHDLTPSSYILEIGPGENPVFPMTEYSNWYGVDKHLEDGAILFKDNHWAENKYPSDHIFAGEFENLSQINSLQSLKGKFDLVVACHSYEHVLEPIRALKEAGRMLRPGGRIVIFAPDGYTDDINTKDPTHTIYLNPEMAREFFAAAGGFIDLIISPYRPNADLVITATKVSL